ncbi:MAG TPA: PIN domain-containing protein [Sediminispirochaeta sp.]|nr:PIN domain-containing protein [Sediminispirochaeta sp.]
MTYVDANVILRYLLDDNPLLSPQAKNRLEELEEKQTGIEVVAECVYVLARVYQVPRKEISEILTRLFSWNSWKIFHKDAVIGAIKLYGTSSIDFVDAYLISLHRISGMEILSFDKKVRQLTR